MEKKSNLTVKAFITIFLAFGLMLSAVGNIYFYTIYSSQKSKIEDKDLEIADLKTQAEELKDTSDSDDEPDNPESSPFEKIFKVEDYTISEALTEIKENVDYKLIYPKEAKLDGDVKYSYVEFYEQGKTLIDFEVVEFGIQKDGVKIGVLEGYTAYGNACDESFDIQTNIGGANVCKSAKIGSEGEFTYSITMYVDTTKNDYDREPLYLFTLTGDYTQEKLETLFGEFIEV